MDIFSQAHLLTAVLSWRGGLFALGVVLTKLTGTGNLQDIGSGNIGATNVASNWPERTCCRNLAAGTAAKAVAVLIAREMSGSRFDRRTFLLGHNFPV